MKERVLLTGFGPFGGDRINPALEAIKRLDGIYIAGAEIVTKELPVVRYKSIDDLIVFIREFDPKVVIAIGQASDNRTGITPERIAINVDDFRIKDNEGNQPIDEPVVTGGPSAYWSTLPVKAIVNRIRSAGIPANVSETAGVFVCNHLFYGLMHYLNAEGNIRRGGFIHIPFLAEQATRIPGQPPSMSLDTIVQGLKLAVEATIKSKSQ